MISSAFITALIAQVNISILPAILLPVTGLSCLLFYNRLGMLSGIIHSLQHELRGQLNGEATENTQKKEERDALYAEYQILLKRSHIVRQAIKMCFITLFLFALSAITVIITLFAPAIVYLTLALWVIGAFFFASAVIYGFREIHQTSLHSLHFQANLIGKWMSPL